MDLFPLFLTFLFFMKDFFKNSLKTIFSLECLFVLWLFSYQYKNITLLSHFPDVTLLSLTLLLPLAIWLYRKEKEPFSPPVYKDFPFLSFLIFSIWLICSCFWSESHHYKLEKILNFSIYTTPGVWIAYKLIGSSRERTQRLLVCFAAFAIFVGAESYRIFITQGLHQIPSILETNYLTTGQTVGVGLCCLAHFSLVYFLKFQKDKNFRTIFAPITLSLLFALLTYALVNLGGRGPVISTILSVLFYVCIMLWKYPKLRLKIITHGSLLFTLSLTVFVVLNVLFDHSTSHFGARIAPLVTKGEIDGAVQERFDFYITAFQAFLSSPLWGIGLGGWPLFHGLGDISLHPHNIFLELLAETGVIGFLLFCMFLFVSLKKNFKQSLFCHSQQYLLLALVLFSFFNALKTGDLHDNLLLFITVTLFSIYPTHKHKGLPRETFY